MAKSNDLYNSMSEENRSQLEDLYNSIMDNMIAEISRNRNISEASISESMNKLLSSSASKCQSLSLIDGIYYEDQVLDILRKEIKELKFIDYSDFRNVKREVDKISKTDKGFELENLLINIVDTTQNYNFTDKFFQEITI